MGLWMQIWVFDLESLTNILLLSQLIETPLVMIMIILVPIFNFTLLAQEVLTESTI